MISQDKQKARTNRTSIEVSRDTHKALKMYKIQNDISTFNQAVIQLLMENDD